MTFRIAVDLDGVLADTMVTFCKILNKRHSTSFTAASFVRWNAWEIAHITKRISHSDKSAYKSRRSAYKSSTDKYGLLYTQPWNRNASKIRRIYRVDRWKQVPTVLEKQHARTSDGE